MELSSLKKVSSQRLLEAGTVKKTKMLHHIKSMHTFGHQIVKKTSLSKIELHSRDELGLKSKRIKTHVCLKTPHFTAVRTARERNQELAKNNDQQSLPSKSLTKSTTYRSPKAEKDPSRRKCSQVCRQRGRTRGSREYAGMLARVQEVVEQYQLQLGRCLQQKQSALKQNRQLKEQIKFLHRKARRTQK